MDHTMDAQVPFGPSAVPQAVVNPFLDGAPRELSLFIKRYLMVINDWHPANLWPDRAAGLVDALVPVLCFLRGNCGLVLTFDEVEKQFQLQSIEKLCWEAPSKYPGLSYTVAPLANYLLNLPGYDRTGHAEGREQVLANQFHGFVVAVVVKALALARAQQASTSPA